MNRTSEHIKSKVNKILTILDTRHLQQPLYFVILSKIKIVQNPKMYYTEIYCFK